jgi:hypothetical protein
MLDKISMQYPSTLIEKLGGPAAFAEVAQVHELAPEGKPLTRDAVYMWKTRKRVPFMWRPAVRAIAAVNSPEGAA